MFTARMKHLTAVVLQQDAETVSRKLLNLGALDFVKITDLDREKSKALAKPELQGSAARIIETRSRIENLAAGADSAPFRETPLSVETVEPLDIDSVEKELDSVAAGLQEIRNRQREVHQEILKFEDLKRQISFYGDFQQSVGGMAAAGKEKGNSLIATFTGSIPATMREPAENKLHRFPTVTLDFDENAGRVPFLVIALRRDQNDITRILNESGWSEEELPLGDGSTRGQALAELDERIGTLQARQDALATDYRGTLDERRDWFARQWAALTVYERLGSIRSYFSRTERTVLFSGWVPVSRQQAVDLALREVCGSRCYLEWHDPAEIDTATEGRVEAPVELKNPGFLKPFEMLVENYAVPEYGSIDPTPLVAIAFLTMFGLMFADAGQGLVIMLIGLVGPRFMKNLSAGVRKLFSLIAYCGGAAIVSGVLFGSYFGHPWFPPLWFNYHALVAGHNSGNPAIRSVYDILLITIYFGISVLAVGLLLNWINLIRKRSWFELLFEKGGILGGWIYAFGVYTAFYFARTGYVELPGGGFLMIAFGIPGILLFFKHPFQARQHNADQQFKPAALLNYLMEWIVELLEIFSGYLANTLSFMRVAGLGIAHASLMLAFDQIAAMTAPAYGSFSPWPMVILLLGNVLVIALEGLSAGIQSLRLNYYEFFSKYFTGSGRAYAPISLRTKT